MHGWLLCVLAVLAVPCAAHRGAALRLVTGADEHGRARTVHYEAGIDFWPFPFAAAGAVAGKLVPLGQYGCGGTFAPPSLPSASAAPRVGIVSRGQCLFQDKIDHAWSYGFDALLVYNQGDTPMRRGLEYAPHITNNRRLPIFFLTYEAGVHLVALAYGHENVTVEYAHAEESPRIPSHQASPAVASFACEEHFSEQVLNLTASQRTRIADAAPQHVLYYAAQLGSAELAAWALAHNASIDEVSPDHGSVLHTAARYSEREGFILNLLKHGADIDVRDAAGRPPLTTAILSETSVVRQLLELGADVHLADAQGYPPIHHACRKNPAICDLVLAFGGDPNYQPDATGRSVLHEAVRRDDLEVVEVLALHPATNFTQPTRDGRLPVDYAAADDMRALLVAIADPDAGEAAGGAGPVHRFAGYHALRLRSALVLAFLVLLSHGRGPLRWAPMLRGLAGCTLCYMIAHDEGSPFPASVMFAGMISSIISADRRPLYRILRLAFTFVLLTDVW
eukprot:TRINITY_DN9406_c0_g2_i1.p1 TRINITY_DN9406_c0_g2~~TRINITY_DN9406_c0_g2_i1.p1  ORF type:complete len:508 (+),score=169.69 TRINITY_DN9406_c0_g2_i1:133-1656(+)